MIQKLTAEKVKHHLEIIIHYIRLKLQEPSQILIEVQRGKKMRQETQALNYDPESAFVQFDYPINFDITMHKKGQKYVKKNFVIKLLTLNGKHKINNGKVVIEFSQIPVLKKPIIRREVPLQHCSDTSAVVSISVRLEQILTKKSLSKHASPNSSLISPNSSIIEKKKPEEPEIKPKPNPKPKEKRPKDPLAVTNESFRSISKDSDLLEVEDAYHNENRDDSFNSKMSFSDFILNPKDSEVESESSSSEEEEVKQIPVERLVANAGPKATRDQVTPNEGSKAEKLVTAEEKGGIATRRDGNCCSACQVF